MSETPDFFSDSNGVLVANNLQTANGIPHEMGATEAVSGGVPGPTRLESHHGVKIETRAAINPSLPSGNVAGNGRSVGRGNERQIAALIPKDFDGETFVHELDKSRLKAQLVRVRELMRDGKWRSLSEIAEVTGDPESSISARLRDCRKPRHGMWTVNRRRRSLGTFEYQFGDKGL